jgi:TPR repeat protein
VGSANTASPDAAAPAASPTVIDEKTLLAEPLSARGAEELAIAQRYLDGAEGQQRNSTEGAKWLWKAIAKHNADAGLLLSDLYLKGDGVEKNCDQARVLLDAAAIRGMKGAGDRLRHLQAFGCQ